MTSITYFLKMDIFNTHMDLPAAFVEDIVFP